MSEQYTPTTDEVRAAWMTSGPPASTVVRAVEFERFLAQVRREAKVEALREAAEAAGESFGWKDPDDADRAGRWLNNRADQLKQEGENDE